MKKLGKLIISSDKVMNKGELLSLKGGTTYDNYKDNPKYKACIGKNDGDACSWVDNGNTYSGKCKTVYYIFQCHS